MLKKRLIPALFIKNGLIVRSENFDYHQFIGSVVHEAKRYSDWDVDELVYIDISREKEYDLRRDDYNLDAYYSMEEIIRKIAEVCFMPLAFGGGIRNLSDVDLRIRNGADKIILNTGAYETPELIGQTASKYGSQCVIVSVDYRMVDGKDQVFTSFGTHATGLTVNEWISRCEQEGAGEIFLNAIDRDGKGNGYDIETIESAVESTKLPVIACGGAADEFDFQELAEEVENLSGIAAGNLFHFTERSYPRAKKYLKENGINVR
ncbi:imidazole glycerol phosphate synthase cyclase subunit [bacterium SCSIO 12741]|nr:imidazole glycerol phosphate synthase cyclase subunit [bacterium SCSIO 12741]